MNIKKLMTGALAFTVMASAYLAPATGSFTYGGVITPEVGQSAAKVSVRRTVTLTASATDATSYRWLKNGEPIEGGTSGTLTVNWRSPKNNPTDTYQAVAVYTIDGSTEESEASAERLTRISTR